MSASKILALTSLFLATTFAPAEWKEFTSADGNFRVLFPDNPQQQTDAERNLHQFSATAGSESYGLEYADRSPNTDWESADGERDSIVNSLGGSVVDEKRTSVEGYPGKWVRFVGQNTSGELAIYFVRQRLYVLHAFGRRVRPGRKTFQRFSTLSGSYPSRNRSQG
jgi:hypothetical protein